MQVEQAEGGEARLALEIEEMMGEEAGRRSWKGEGEDGRRSLGGRSGRSG